MELFLPKGRSTLALSAVLAALILIVPDIAAARGGGHGTGSNASSHSVRGHTTKSGTYVAPHHATNPNHTKLDNYSTKGLSLIHI